MKKIITITLFIYVCKICLSQTFAPSGSYWRYCYNQWGEVPGGGAPGFTSFSTFIEPTQTETINGKEIITLSEEISGTTYIYKFHTSGDTTFVFNVEDSTLTELFNFSFQAGDTMHLNHKNSIRTYESNPTTSGYARYVVDTVGTLNIQGYTYRYYTMKYDHASSPNFFQSISDGMRTFKIIEKMGLEGFILPVFYGGAWDGAYVDLIYYKNNTVDNFYGNSQNVCNLSFEDVQIWLGNIFPNPTDEWLYVNSPLDEVSHATITDLQGRVVKNQILLLPSTSNVISLSQLSSGIYTLSISGKNGRLITRKIVKN